MFIPWELMEWVIGAVASAVAGVGLWVWKLGARVDKNTDRIATLRADNARLETKLEKLESLIEEMRHEAERARVMLKEELLDAVRGLPTRIFIESQMQQLTGRIDGLIDARLRHPPGRRSSEEQ